MFGSKRPWSPDVYVFVITYYKLQSLYVNSILCLNVFYFYKSIYLIQNKKYIFDYLSQTVWVVHPHFKS